MKTRIHPMLEENMEEILREEREKKRLGKAVGGKGSDLEGPEMV